MEQLVFQGGTSHNFGNGFAKAFDIQFLDSDNTLKYAYETSWGVSTRIIGGIIMLMLGLLGEYIGKIYMETKERPKFIIEKELD